MGLSLFLVVHGCWEKGKLVVVGFSSKSFIPHVDSASSNHPLRSAPLLSASINFRSHLGPKSGDGCGFDPISKSCCYSVGLSMFLVVHGCRSQWKKTEGGFERCNGGIPCRQNPPAAPSHTVISTESTTTSLDLWSHRRPCQIDDGGSGHWHLGGSDGIVEFRS